MLLRQLESQYPTVPATADLSPYAGVVASGGALESAYVLRQTTKPALNNAAERMHCAGSMKRRIRTSRCSPVAVVS